MPNTKISDLAALATLETGDRIPLVDVSDTTMAESGTDKYATPAVLLASPIGTYRVILQSEGSIIAGQTAGTYGIPYGGNALVVSGAGSVYPLGVIQIATADYPTITGVASKLRIRAQLFTNDVAPTGNFTFGLYPITRPATSGGTGVCIFTLGTVVSGSNGASFTTPAADLLGSAVGADFAIPADGPYVIGVVTTGTIATNAHVHLCAQLQLHHA